MDLVYVCVLVLFRFIYGCPDGYHGLNCSTPCRYPSYGFTCQLKCNCTEEVCNHITGCIQQDEECLDGYFGHGCVSPCRYPNYGQKCQNQCSCNITECNHKVGCNTLPINYDNITKRDDSTHHLQKHPVLFIIGGSALLIAILVFAVCIILVRKYRAKRKREREGNFDSEFSSFSYHDDANDRNLSVRYCDNMEVRNNHKLDIYENTVF